MKNLILLVMSMVCSLYSNAQTGQLKGKIVDGQKNTPLSGARIYSNNSKTIFSNHKGAFNMNCTDSVALRIEFSGYTSLHQTIKCNGTDTFVFELMPLAQQLGTVVVTASSKSSRSPLEIPGSPVILEKTQLIRATGLYLDDAINTNVPGATMQRRTHSGGQQINIRGYGSGMGFRGVSSNFDGQGLKVYLNGIAITDAEGITVMDDLDFGSITQAEIVKGPSGTLYGLAIAGAINLKTDFAPKNQTSIGQDVMAGSYGLLRTNTRVRIGGEKSSLLLNLGHQQFNGFMPHTQSNKEFVNLVSEIELSHKQRITSYFGYADSYDERNGELTAEQYENFDYSGNPKYIKNNAHSAVLTFRAGLGHTYDFNEHVSNTTTIFGTSQSMDNSSAGGWTDKLPMNFGIRSIIELDFKVLHGMRLTSTSGIEAQRMHSQILGYGMSADSTKPNGYNIISGIRSNQVTSNTCHSYFSQWTLGLPMQFSLTVGAGVSNLALQLDDRSWGIDYNHPNSNRLRSFKSSYNNLISPTVSINKKIADLVSIYATYSTGYKAPVSSNMIISTTGQLNTVLKPEKGSQIELGTKGSFLNEHLAYTLAVFNTVYENKFTAVTVQNSENTATLYSYLVNGGRLNNKGVELAMRHKLIESNTGMVKLLQAFANFTYSDFRYENYKFERVGKGSNGEDSTIVEDYSGKSVAGVAPFVFNAGIDVVIKAGLYGNVHYNHRSTMPYTSDGLNETKAYGVLNAKIGFRKKMNAFEFDLYAGANNITGDQYYQMVFVNQLPDAFIPAPNRVNFFEGLNLSYIL